MEIRVLWGVVGVVVAIAGVAMLFSPGQVFGPPDAESTTVARRFDLENCHEAQTSVAMLRSIHQQSETETVGRLLAEPSLATMIPGPIVLTVSSGDIRDATATASAYNMWSDPRAADDATAANRC